MSSARRPLRRRMMLVFTAFTLGVAALFALYAVTFMYVVEDRFFEAQLTEEAAYLLEQHASTGHWSTSRRAHMTLHADAGTFPPDLRQAHTGSPRAREIPGADGRHYHLRRIVAPSGDAVWLVAETSAQLVVRPMREEAIQVLVPSAAAVVGLALLLAYWMARRTAAPLERLASLVESMRPGELPEGLSEPFPDDEVAVLARGLESLAGRVRDFITREQAFTRDASHELRTPLTVIRSAAERLAKEPAMSSEAQQHLAFIRDSVAQLEQTVTTLLALAREASVSTSDQKAATKVLPVVERVIVEQSALIEHKPVTVEVDIAPGASFPVSAPVLQILLSNLVGNAFAHSEAGEVRIALQEQVLSISNSGYPVDAALMQTLREPFVRREGSAGFGLGLAIVQRVCDQYGLLLMFKSDAERTEVSLRMA